MDPLRELSAFIDARACGYDALARDIWEHPELSHREERSSAVHRERLAAGGFRVREFPEMPYSFVAEKGRGGPIIAYMGEYDALPGLSQAREAVRRQAPDRDPAYGDAGHGCGHNLLGIGCLAAAEAAAAVLESAGLPGTVRYYGCTVHNGLATEET